MKHKQDLEFVEFGDTPCPHCRGLGRIQRDTVSEECPKCEGVGEVVIKRKP